MQAMSTTMSGRRLITIGNFKITIIGSPKIMAIGILRNFLQNIPQSKVTNIKDPQTPTIMQMNAQICIKNRENKVYVLSFLL